MRKPVSHTIGPAPSQDGVLTMVILKTILCATSGMLIGFGALFDGVSQLAILWIAIAIHSATSDAWRVSAFRGALTGGSAYAAAGWWVPGVLSNLGAPASAIVGLWGAAIFLCAVVPWIALAIAIRQFEQLAIFPAATLLALVTYAVETLITTPSYGLPAFLIAYSTSGDLGLMQGASIAGIPGLSAAVVFASYLLARAHESKRPWRIAGLVVSSWIVASAFGLEAAQWIRSTVDKPQSPSFDLLAIHPAIPRSERWLPEMQIVHLGQLIEYSRKAVASQPTLPDAIIWPENSLTVALESHERIEKSLIQFVDGIDTALILGHVTRASTNQSADYASSVSWYAPTRGAIATMRKAVAIPVLESGEDSALSRAVLPLLGEISSWPRVEEAAPSGPLLGDFEVAAVLCYEILFPRVVAGRRTSETVAIINLADEGWAKHEFASRLMNRLARFVAVQHRLPLIRLTQGGTSTAFDEFGRVTSEAEPGRFESLSLTSRSRLQPPISERLLLASFFVGPGLLFWTFFPRKGLGFRRRP